MIANTRYQVPTGSVPREGVDHAVSFYYSKQPTTTAKQQQQQQQHRQRMATASANDECWWSHPDSCNLALTGCCLPVWMMPL